ncbi:MAG: FkbM family methyltransferase [Reyranella sp.]|uniref:FkbM family methyltransferase n=1 Tax=Reyranella sp. TaxID=1929291 RepID=UPI003D11057F
MSPKSDRMLTAIPGRPPIELVAFYEEFRDYYPLCEQETKRWFVEHVRPDWWIFDVGANIGYYTILFSQLAPAGRVFAFEPTTTADMLRANLAHNKVGNAAVHEVALGAKTGQLNERIFRIWGSEGEVKEYPFYRFDDFVREQGIERVDCLKIDVDSFDFEVLRGAEQTLLKHDPVIVIELNHALAKRDQSPAETLAWLAKRGYRKALTLDRHDNYVLQRSEAAFAGLAPAASMELLFPPPARVDERMAAGGTPLGRSFVKGADLLNGAALRPASAPSPSLWNRLFHSNSKPDEPRRVDLREVLDVPVETSADRWGYALSLALEPGSADDLLTVGIAVEVVDGALGIVACGQDSSKFVVPERVLAAMPGLQHVVIEVPRKDIQALIFRNIADDGSRTVFKLSSVEARMGVPG